ncbi:hypothetical protein B0T25DRAFT_156087 [Lasiosphaeria hispida]|uniref:Uncharacterized protein n=1 Tax=Lasiosphaeria hispida TaxID=260671 RepID=A0AAJ0HMA0_9PEZI|nr:hypothetical protein B0T25DRAFT_156087 [Lasiosphaeria hispida]
MAPKGREEEGRGRELAIRGCGVSLQRVGERVRRRFRRSRSDTSSPSNDMTLDGGFSAPEPMAEFETQWPATCQCPSCFGSELPNGTFGNGCLTQLNPHQQTFQELAFSNCRMHFGENGSRNSSDVNPFHAPSDRRTLGSSSHNEDQQPQPPLKRRFLCVCERVLPRHESCPGARYRDTEPDGTDGCAWEAQPPPGEGQDVDIALVGGAVCKVCDPGGQDEQGGSSGGDEGRQHLAAPCPHRRADGRLVSNT